MSRTGGISRKVLERQNDIAKRCILDHESAESVSETYGRSPRWVEGQLDQALKRFLLNSPKDVGRRIPGETVLPSRAEINRLKREAGEEHLASQLQREDLNKEQLREIKPKIGRSFYSRHKRLFIRLPDLIKKSGLPPTTPADLAAVELEQDGIAVFSYHERNERDERASVRYLVLMHDVDPSVDTLKSSEVLKEYQGTSL